MDEQIQKRNRALNKADTKPVPHVLPNIPLMTYQKVFMVLANHTEISKHHNIALFVLSQ